MVLIFLQLFEKVEVDKPAASRSASAEIYVLGLKYKAPAKIDPRLLDVKHLFQGSVEPQKKVILLFWNINNKLTLLKLSSHSSPLCFDIYLFQKKKNICFDIYDCFVDFLNVGGGCAKRY